MGDKQKDSKKSKASKIIGIIIAVILVSILLIVLIISLNKSTNNVDNIDIASLIGTFSYEEDTKYKFDKNGRGALFIKNQKYNYSYKIKDDKLIIDFDDEHVHDATYSYQLDNNSLKLIGEEGTAGGEYILYKD